MKYLEAKYPLFVDISGEKIIVVGGGNVAERKIETLLNYGAAVKVIAPTITERVRELAGLGSVELELREYRDGDLWGAFMVMCATDSRVVNERVYAEAHARGCLINVADVPELCNFYVPSVVSRGPLQIAISTSGAAPTVAKQLRRELSARYGEEWATYVTLMGKLRALVLERVPGGEAEHKPIFSMLANSGLYERVVAGEPVSPASLFVELVVPFAYAAGQQIDASELTTPEVLAAVRAAATPEVLAYAAGQQVDASGLATPEVLAAAPAAATRAVATPGGDASGDGGMRESQGVRTAHTPQNNEAVQAQESAVAPKAGEGSCI